MDGVMSETLKEIGWDSGFRLPIANEENQKLEAELARLVIKKAMLLKNSEDSKEKYNNLKNHVKYVKQEAAQNQQLLTTYHQQLDNQKHKLRLKSGENDQLHSEIKRMDKEIIETKERMASKRNALTRSMAKLEKIKAEAEWDAEAMKAWEEALKKRDADNEMIQRFSQEDQRRIIEMETKRQHLQVEVTGRKSLLEKMDVDITNYEQVLFRTGKMMQQLKEERQGLVHQWQESVKNLRQKDVDITRASKHIEGIQEQILQRREMVEEQETFLSQEKNNNKYVEMEIEEKGLLNSRIRKEGRQIWDENALLSNDFQTKKKMFEGLAHEHRKEQLALRNMQLQSESSLKRLQASKDELKQWQDEAHKSKRESLSASQNADFLEESLLKAQKSGKRLERLEMSLQNRQFKVNSQTADLAKVVDAKRSELSALENALSKVRKFFGHAHTRLIHKKQLLSDLEMKVACLEAQLGNLEGDDIKENLDMWNQRIEELESALAQQNEVKHLLSLQILKLQKENLRLVSAISGDNDHHQSLKDKLQSFVLMIEGGIKQAQTGKLRTQQKQVEENVLKLKVDKLDKAMNSANKQIYDLQRFRLDLESVIKERHIEVTTAKEVLFARKKNLEEDRGRLRADISLRCVRIQQLINKYNIGLGLLGKDETGEPISVATFKLRAAQEKYMLQQEGDQLDHKIRKAEGEIVAIENTLKVVNLTNKNFKESLTFVEDQSEDANKLKDMELLIVEHNSLLRNKRQILMVIMERLTESQKEADKCKELMEESCQDVQTLQNNLTLMHKEDNDRQTKIERAHKQIMHCKKSVPDKQMEKYDKELYIRQLQDTNKNVLYHLADFMQENAEVQPVLEMHMENQRLSLPKLRTSFSTVSSDSIRTPSSAGASQTGLSRNAKTERPSLAIVTSLELKFDDDSLAGSSKSSSATSSKKS